MEQALEKGVRVTTGGKSRGEIGGEAGEVTGVAADAPTTDGLGERYGTFIGWGMAAGKVEVLLVVGGFDLGGGAEVRFVNKDVNIKYPYLFPKPSMVGTFETTPETYPSSPPISPLPSPPMVILSPFSNARFIAPLYPPYPKPNPFVP